LVALSRLLPEFQADLVPTVTLTQSKQTQRRIGSPYCPKLETIRRLSDELKSRFEIEMRQPIGKLTLPYIHNAYTLYTVLGFYPVTADIPKKRHTVPKECSCPDAENIAQSSNAKPLL